MIQERTSKAQADPSLFVCDDAPVVPAKGAGEKARATYTVGLYGAYSDCKNKLNTAGIIAKTPDIP